MCLLDTNGHDLDIGPQTSFRPVSDSVRIWTMTVVSVQFKNILKVEGDQSFFNLPKCSLHKSLIHVEISFYQEFEQKQRLSS